VLAIMIWIAASLLFTLYVSHFSSYDKTYGTLGGVVVFLVWLWITNMAILLGAEFNAEISAPARWSAARRVRPRSCSSPSASRPADLNAPATREARPMTLRFGQGGYSPSNAQPPTEGGTSMMDRVQAEEAIAKMLIDSVERDRYPSSTQMDLVEQSMTPEVASEYLEMLLDKVSGENYPSISMLRRMQRIAESLPEPDPDGRR
jgi:Virulence factor BrkB